jgi:hypothetical protein
MIHLIKNVRYYNPYPNSQKQNLEQCGGVDFRVLLDRRGIPTGFYGTDGLACFLGTRINERDIHSYTSVLRGMAVDEKEETGLTIDDFAKPGLVKAIKEKYGLDVEVHKPSQIRMKGQRLEEFLIENIVKDNDVMINFRWDELRHTEDGHFVLLAAYDEQTHEVYVADSSYGTPEYWKIPITRFSKAMEAGYPEKDNKLRERGFIVFSGPIMNRPKEDYLEIEKHLVTVKDYEPTVRKVVREENPEPRPDGGRILRPETQKPTIITPLKRSFIPGTQN